MTYGRLTDTAFVNLIFTSADRLGEDYVAEAEKRRHTVVPLLCRVLEDESNYEDDGTDRWWGTVHAVNILGILGDDRAMGALLTASEYSSKYDIEWIWDALAECYLRIGPAAVPPIREAIRKSVDEMGDRLFSCEMEGLWNIWEAYPDCRDEIEDFLLDILNTGSAPYEMVGDIIADFASIHRTDLKPFFEELYDAGEVDLDTLPREDMDYFYSEAPAAPGHRMDIRRFYSAEEIEKRRVRWEKTKAEWEKRDFESYMIDHLGRTGRNAPCPCGSGQKFKKCHLDWATERARKRKEEEDLQEPHRLAREAVSMERRSESDLRRFLARKGQTPMFERLQEAVQTALTDPKEKFLKKRFFGYFQPLFKEIEFRDEEELKWFTDTFMDYYNALSFSYRQYPRESNHLHS